METSESEESIGIMSSPRLGNCEVCATIEARYTCPKCEVKTCSLGCVKIHKKELNCDGIRDRTKYIPLKQMTKMDLMNDYYFLEECTRFVEDRKRDSAKRFTTYNKTLPPFLFRLRSAARERGTTLRFLLQNFTKRQKNTSQLDFKTSTILWRIEWCFPNAEMATFIDDCCSENETIHDLLNKYINPAGEPFYGKSRLEFYQARGLNGLRVLLKAEGIKRCRNRYFELNPSRTLRESLAGRTIVEYPSVFIVFKETIGNNSTFEVIDSDDDVEQETRVYQQYLDSEYGRRKEQQRKQQEKTNSQSMEVEERDCSRELSVGIDAMEIERKREDRLRRKRRDSDASLVPINFLFSDENENWLEDSDSDGNTTEEEKDEEEADAGKSSYEEMFSPKRQKIITT